MLHLRHLLCFLFVCLLAFAPRKAEAQIFADVTVAGGVNGTFTITLEHLKTPNTVANFIRLATGEGGWFDYTTGAIRYTPFYNGVIFHRVIAGFMNQTGSRNGLGTDGPGYSFRDEFDATLTHTGPYVVSMANSGTNTNGSQLFITVSTQTHLNNVHTVFGHVTAGQNIIDGINATPTVSDRPTTPIAIQSINIHGPSLAGFNLRPPSLPTLTDAKPILKRTTTDWLLQYDKRTFSDYLIYHGASMSAWSSFGNGYAGSTAFTGDVNMNTTAVGPQHFYRMARVDYSTAATADRGGNTFAFSSPLGGTAVLNPTKTGGTWVFDGESPSTLTSAQFGAIKPYSAQIRLDLSNGVIFLLTLHYNTATGGKYVGQTNVTNFENVSGTFTVAP